MTLLSTFLIGIRFALDVDCSKFMSLCIIGTTKFKWDYEPSILLDAAPVDSRLPWFIEKFDGMPLCCW